MKHFHSPVGRGRSANSPQEIPFAGWRDILLRTKKQLSEDNLSLIAGGVTYFALLGLFPFLLALLSFYGLFANPQDIYQQMEIFQGILPEGSYRFIQEQLMQLSQQNKAVGFGAAIGILASLWGGTKAIKAIMDGLNMAYDEKEKRGFFKRNLLAMGLSILGMLSIALSVGLVAILPSLLGFIGLGSSFTENLAIWLRWPLLILMSFLGLALIYRYGPSRAPAQWKWVSWGSFLATLLWIGGSALFSFYISNIKNLNKTYGTMGAFIIFLMWMYLTSYIILLGAELNSEIEHQTNKDSTSGPPKPMGERGAVKADTEAEIPK